MSRLNVVKKPKIPLDITLPEPPMLTLAGVVRRSRCIDKPQVIADSLSKGVFRGMTNALSDPATNNVDKYVRIQQVKNEVSGNVSYTIQKLAQALLREDLSAEAKSKISQTIVEVVKFNESFDREFGALFDTSQEIGLFFMLGNAQNLQKFISNQSQELNRIHSLIKGIEHLIPRGCPSY